MFPTIRKELLLLLRDPGGLVLLLLMPALLIIVMAMVQDAPFKDYQEMKVEMLLVNRDGGVAGERIAAALKGSHNFVVADSLDGQPLSEQELKHQIASGKFQIGIIVPPNATKTLVNTSNKLANELAQSMGAPGMLPVNASADSARVQILFDPVTKPAFRASISYALDQFVSQVKMEILMERLSRAAGNGTPLNLDAAALNTLSVAELQVGDTPQLKASLNSVQHNVPAWAIFGMFLIVIPMSGNMIRERDEGSAVRLQLIPDVAAKVAVGKILFYVLLCLVQFVAMLAVGLLVLPLLGLPRLYLGAHPGALLPMAVAIAFAATSYGYFIGNVFKTANQAMPFGAISVVLMSAIGGVWVPVQILPPLMQRIARISPQHWSLEGINSVMLRGASLSGIIIPFLIVCFFGVVLTLFSVWFRRR